MRAFCFGDFVLEPQERRLLRNGVAIDLTPKAFDTLVYLVGRHGHLVSKDELMHAVWSDVVVEDGNLPRMIHVLRRALGQDGTGPQFIETVPTRGYRFVGDVSPALAEVAPAGVPPIGASAEHPGKAPSRIRLFGPPVIAVALAATVLIWMFSDRSDSEAGGLARMTTSSGAAYTHFRTGRLYIERQHPGDFELALQEFDAAISLDPRFADAHAGKADARIFLFWNTGSHDDITQARQAVERAISLDPNNAYARTLLCRIRAVYDWDYQRAESECRRAVVLDPANHEARREYAFLLNSTGRRKEAMEQMDAAIALAPTSFNKRSRGTLLYYGRRYDEAIEQLEQVQSTDPEFVEISQWIARSFEQKGDYPQALEFLIRSRDSDGPGGPAAAVFRGAFESGGWPAVLRVSLASGRLKPNMETAGTLAQLGETDLAFGILDQMISARRVKIVQMDSDPRLDPLRSDPRYDQLARRAGLR